MDYRTFPALSIRRASCKAELIRRSGFEITEADLQWLVAVFMDCVFLFTTKTPSKVGSRRVGYDEEGSLGLQL
jgi:hypothetical protein